jgi:hypothetical protein
MKIYFGRIPDCKVKFLDDKHLFPMMLAECDYKYTKAVDMLMKDLKQDFKMKFGEISYYTINPMIPNYMSDEYANKYLFFIDENGNEINFGEDEQMQSKLKFMSPGEALMDSERVLPS